MEECRHFTNGKCTNPDGGGVCYCGCPSHKKSGVRDNGAQQPHAVKVEDSHIPEAGTSAQGERWLQFVNRFNLKGGTL